jgi:hypothetical protein
MNAPTPYLLPTHSLRRLEAFLTETGSEIKPADALTMAIEQWIATQSCQFTSLKPTPSRGYQWKTLFLPAGTRLRVNFGGHAFYADVQGDALIYEGRAMSPSQFANQAAGAGRNAWREVWLRFPGEQKWRPASLLRRQLEQQAPAPPRTVTPAEAMEAAAACMSETLKSALALVDHVRSRALPQLPEERRGPDTRRVDDTLADWCAAD